MRVDARSVMIFRLSTTPGTTSCSSPEYRSSVFSRTMTRSTFSNRDRTWGRLETGRRFEYRSSAFRSPTLTLVNPSPTGVVTGPFNATLFRRTDAMSSSGSGEPDFSSAGTPASNGSQVIDTPAASMIDTTADVTSGPMPSPGINVIVWVMRRVYRHALPRTEAQGRQSRLGRGT